MIAVCVLIFTANSCDKAKSGELQKTLKTTKTYDGKEVELTGKLGVGSKVRHTEGMPFEAVLEVGIGDNVGVVGIPLNYGKVSNGIEINSKEDGSFEDVNVHFYDKDGKEITSKNAKVKGTVKYLSTEANDFSYVLENVNLEQIK